MNTLPNTPRPLCLVEPSGFRTHLARFIISGSNGHPDATPWAAMLDLPTGYTDSLCYMSPALDAGFAISRDNTLHGLFRWRSSDWAGLDLIRYAQHETGQLQLSCYGGFLRSLYEYAGFQYECEAPFDATLAPPGYKPAVHGTPIYYELRWSR